MDKDEYLKDRLDDQINWYDKKSIKNQSNYKILRIIEIISAVLIPFLSALSINNSSFTFVVSILVSLLGVIITFIASMLSLGKYQENWIEYRTTCESLKKEKYLFLTNTIPYNTDNAFSILTHRVESLISKENTNWDKKMSMADSTNQLNSN